MFPPVGGVGLDGSSGSWTDDGFGVRWCGGLEGYWDDVVVLLDCNPLGVFKEVSDEAEMDGVRWALYFIC